MRATFQATVSKLIDSDKELVLLLGDIGVYGFREAMAKHPDRVINIGILEQAMTGFASGLALAGKIPVVHTIAPFLIERCLEQIKVDFGYQKLAGKFISVGASFDYSKLGATHHSPGDVLSILGIPGFEVFLPSTNTELSTILNREVPRDSLSYIRLAEEALTELEGKLPDRAGLLEHHSAFRTILAFGPSIREAIIAARTLGISLIYSNEISTAAISEIRAMLIDLNVRDLAIIQPFYEGTVAHYFVGELPRRICDIGVPRKFITNYGSVDELKMSLGLDVESVTKRLEQFFDQH